MNDCVLCGADYGERRYDARGIYITRCCDKCWEKEKARYRPEVLSDPNYEACEDIEPN